ncbi:sugar ABC transporter substrate-binding protein [Nocardioides sp. GXZ039]|uniref:sugar ABC transporter substrate-binding protein n=1 Tax=Nocardioides sp. GXZ039 TaxID=3136018 RepID=UPI0030F37BAA
MATPAGCSGAKGATFGYLAPFGNTTFVQFTQIIESNLESAGATVKTENANLDPGAQMSQGQSLLLFNPKALIINPLSDQALVPFYQAAEAKGVKLVGQEPSAEYLGPYASSLRTDVDWNVQAAVKLLAEKVGKGGKVAALVPPDVAAVMTEARLAFEKYAKQYGLDVVAETVVPKLDSPTARNIVDTWKQKYGSSLAGIWSISDEPAAGAASAVDGSFHPAIVTQGQAQSTWQLVESGKLYGVVDGGNARTGNALAYAALKAACNQPLPSTLWLRGEVVTKANAGTYTDPVVAAKQTDFRNLALEDIDGKIYIK